MESKENIESYTFESRAAYERAKKEDEIIQQLTDKADLSEPKTALKVYNKVVEEKVFSTVVGYQFLKELRDTIVESGIADEKMLPEIPVPYVSVPEEKDTMPERSNRAERYRRLYEGQVLLNKKLKIALTAAVILLLGFIIINVRFEYSIFTYFTNYKANMEEELIDKYEDWENDLEQREQQLEQSSSQDDNSAQ
jgi:hypothetical protein